MRPDALDQPADRDLRQPAAQEHRRRQAAHGHERDVVADTLVDDLGQRHRYGVEHQPGAERDHHKEAENRCGDWRRKGNVGRRAARGRVSPLVGNHPEIGDAGGDADQARHEEGAAPGERRGQGGGDAGCERDAEIAADAVEGERAAALGRVLDEHRGAHRMIDGGKDAEREQCHSECVERRREGGADQRQSAADIERRHHVAAAPAVGEPARRQREQSEGDEGGGAERNQLGIGTAGDRRQLDDHRRIDQDHEVIECVGAIEEADRQPPA